MKKKSLLYLNISILKNFKFFAKNFQWNLLKNPGVPLANRSTPGIFSSDVYREMKLLLPGGGGGGGMPWHGA